jgi:hypothetical protein
MGDPTVRAWRIAVCGIALALCSMASARADDAPRSVETDRRWDVLPSPHGAGGPRASLEVAGRELGDWPLHLAGVTLVAEDLIALSQTPADEPLLRALRERLRRPVDLDDLLLFLDDVLRDGRRGLRGERVWVTPGRARRSGILIHPDEVFGGAARRYGSHGPLAIDMPKPQIDLPAAHDGDPPGAGWTMRYLNPQGEDPMLAALSRRRGSSAFETRVRDLMLQLRRQGAEVYLNSSVRSPERGYLMWGAFLLSRSEDERSLLATRSLLDRANADWGLDVPIRWWHPAGWRATREAAREMADSYDVVYATEAGARSSRHYTGHAVDLVAVGLPRRLELVAPDAAHGRFELSAPEQTRDLSLTPELIEWIEAHFDLHKLRSDYPHWDDARP